MAYAAVMHSTPHPNPLPQGERGGTPGPNQLNRTLMVMAGGTGGHVYPALAVANEMRARGWEVFWLGTKNGLEARVVPASGIDIVWVSVSGLRGNGLLRFVLTPFMLLRAFWQSLKTILSRRPDVVLGMGGYTAFPGGMMASLLNKPLVIHEQNSIAGLTNRILACLADKVLVAFPSAFKNANDKPLPCRDAETSWTGNPVREPIARLTKAQDKYAGREGRLRLLADLNAEHKAGRPGEPELDAMQFLKRVREAPRDVDAGDLGAALAAEPRLRVLVSVAVGGVASRVGGRLDVGPAQILRSVLGQRPAVIGVA